jgi:hypothetical protein
MSGTSVSVLRSVASTCVNRTSRIFARGPGVDLDDQRGTIRVVRRLQTWRQLRRRVAAAAIFETQHLGDFGETGRARRVPEALGDSLSKVVLGEFCAADEGDAIDRMTRHQQVLHTDAVADWLALNPHVLVAAQRHQVRDRLAHRTHRQTVTDTRLDQPQHSRLVDNAALLIELDFDDGLAGLASAGRGPFRMQNTEDSRMRMPRSLSHLERLPDAPVEGVDAVLVAPQDPRETIALIEFEQDDLVTIGRCEAARVGEVDALESRLRTVNRIPVRCCAPTAGSGPGARA